MPRDKRFIAHIGMGKCGSTAIQKFLHNNRSRLSAGGIRLAMPFYECKDVFNAALSCYAEYNYPPELPALQCAARRDSIFHGLDPEKVLDQYGRNLAGDLDKDILFSDEAFAGFEPRRNRRRIEMLSRIYQPFARTHRLIVLLYMRRQDDALQSLYQQLFKPICFRVPFDRYKSLFPPFRKGSEQGLTLDYLQIVRQISQALGDHAAVIARSYDRARRKDLRQDFVEAAGIGTLGLVRPEKTRPNRGISNQAIRLLEYAADFPVADQQELIHLVGNKYGMIREVGQTYPFLSQADAADIMEHYRQSNQEVFQADQEEMDTLFASRTQPDQAEATATELLALILPRLVQAERTSRQLAGQMQHVVGFLQARGMIDVKGQLVG